MARSVSIAIALVCAAACAGPPNTPASARIQAPSPGGAAPWTHLRVDDAPGDFKFALVADRTGRARTGVFADGIEKLGLLQPAFVLSVGDLIEGYTEDGERLDAEWAELDALVEGLEAPFFYVAGNHDYSNSVMARDWMRRFGGSFYHFVYRDVLFLVLNSELFASVRDPSQPVRGPETLEQQLDYAERVLGEHTGARWTIVVLHQPLWEVPQVRAEWERFEALLDRRPYTVFAGHHHAYTKHVRRGRSYITLATTGGVSALRGVAHGEFDHLALVTMTSQGPVLANLMLDGIRDEDVRTEAGRRLVRRLGKAVELEPLDAEAARAGAARRMRIHNPSQGPLRVRARIESGPHLRVEPASFERVLAPGERGIVELAVRRDPATRATELAPAWLVLALEAQGDQGPVRVELRRPLLGGPEVGD